MPAQGREGNPGAPAEPGILSCRMSRSQPYDVMNAETVLILASGSWTEAGRLGALVASADYIIAANGGFSKALTHGVRVDEVVGDLDSASDQSVCALDGPTAPPVDLFPRDKDWTDLELAIDRALLRDPAKIVLVGAAGDRLDHTLTNLHLLEKGILAGVPMVLMAGDEDAHLVNDRIALDGAKIADRVSLVPVSDSVVVTTHGLQFPLRSERLCRPASRGVSNIVDALPVRICVEKGLLLVIHAAMENDEHG